MATRTPFNFKTLLDPKFRVPDLSIEPGKAHPKPWIVFTTVPPSALSIMLERMFHARFTTPSQISFPQGHTARLVIKPSDFDGHSKGTLFVATGGPTHMIRAAQTVIDHARAQGFLVRPLFRSGTQ